MRQILHAFKLRLTNLSQGNRALKLGKLSTRRDIDLTQLAYLAEKSAEELLQSIIAGREVTLIREPDPRHEPTNLADRRLNRIFRSVEMLFAESGTYDLYLGYPFVEGKFLDGTVTRSPLLLLPVRLERNLQGRPRWKLQPLTEPVIPNPTFFLAYEQYQQWRFPAEFWEEELDKQRDFQLWMQSLYALQKRYEWQLNFNSDLFTGQLIPFPDYRKERLDQFGTGKLKLQPQAVLGIFPQSDSTLLKDYETIAQQPEIFPLSYYLEGGALQPPAADSPQIREEDRYFIAPVDASQEAALLGVKQGQSLVLHGPPGTGKSQVIVNLISDALAHGKRVLLVSQKRAALDVVYKRLDGAGLSRFAMLVHDHRHDRSEVYRKLHKQILDIEQFQAEFRDLNLTKAEHEYRVISRQLDQQTNALAELAACLQDRSRFGLSPHELYLRSDPHAESLELTNISGRLSEERLQQFLEKLRAVRDYREFYAERYPWRQRLSFRHFQQQDRQRLLAFLQKLPEQLQTLADRYQGLSETFGRNLFDLPHIRSRIATFRRFDRYHQQATMRRGLEALQLDQRSHRQLAKDLNTWGQALDAIDQATLIRNGDWQRLASLEKQVPRWQTLQGHPLRWLHPAFLQANWYLRRLLKGRVPEVTSDLVAAFCEQYAAMQALKRQYGRLHDQTFFEDFPLLEPQAAKRRWLRQKQQQYKAWLEIRGLDFWQNLSIRWQPEGWDDAAWQASMERVQAISAWTEALQEARSAWTQWLHPAQIEQLEAWIQTPEEIVPSLQHWQQTCEKDFFDLQSLDRLLATLDHHEETLLKELSPWLPTELPQAELERRLCNRMYLDWLEWLEDSHPVLREVSGRGWERSLSTYHERWERRAQDVALLVQRRLKERILETLEFNRLKNRVTFRDIEHQVRKKRRLWPIRKLVQQTWDQGLPLLAPCWLASPESAAAMFPMQASLFDLVIFDEASQCFAERALPVMLRGRQSVIAGDDRQLPPSDLYRVRYEEYLDDEAPIALEVASVLDLARQNLPQQRLCWHYRSESEALIRFSNDHFYEGTLQMIPPARMSSLHQPPLNWIAVDGHWENNCNLPEARRVIGLILALARRADQPTVGVVTMNFQQQELILDELEQTQATLAASDPEGYQALMALMQRVAGEEQQGLFVKNIENVQGDERDVIIFSTGYAADASGKLHTRFGLLNQAGGENRLNVAVTRARWQVYVVCSFHPEALQVSHTAHAGPKLFKAYLQHVWEVANGADQMPNPESDANAVGELARKVAARLADLQPQLGLGQTAYRLDLALPHPQQAGYRLGIECEGPQYFQAISAKERDLYRPALLRRQHWQLYRVWARNWWLRPEAELEHLLARYRSRT